MKNYNVFKIYSNPFQPDLISGLLWELNITGITEEVDHLIVFADEEADVNEERIKKYLEKLISEKLLNDYSIVSESLPEENWNELWEKGREVIRVSDKFVIKPTFKDYKTQQGEIVLTIDPKMSFGTGEHQSTKLIIKLLEKYVRPGMHLLDVGSGTGILSIAAIKLGAVAALAVDNDERCYENCKENCDLNSVTGKVKIVKGEISDLKEDNFDLIIANIQKDVLLDIADQIGEKIKPNGIAILSGLLIKDEKDIEQHYSETGFETVDTESMDEWIAIVLMVHTSNWLKSVQFGSIHIFNMQFLQLINKLPANNHLIKNNLSLNDLKSLYQPLPMPAAGCLHRKYKLCKSRDHKT